MSHRKAILWDFDGTLAVNRLRWSGCFLKVLEQHCPDHGFTVEDVRPLLAAGYPWHTPDIAHLELCDPDKWWSALEAVLADGYSKLGFPDDAAILARRLHEMYVEPSAFELFPDVVPVLSALEEAGWRHFVMSNHMPELRAICSGIGLGDLIEEIINSAETGYEKPHPEAFRVAKEVVGPADKLVMVGDSPIADVQGAEQAGIAAILVRTRNDSALYHARDLFEVEKIIYTLSRP